MNPLEPTMPCPSSSIPPDATTGDRMVRGLTLMAVSLFVATSAIAIDQARAKSKVDEAIAKYGVTGKNAIVAIFDRGIDWKNADFRNADGTTRIEYIFDLSDNSGASAPGNTYGIGTIYTKDQINAALANNTPLNTRDAVGHGTTTTAIAAGGGRNDSRYRGIAPDAHIITVKFTSEGAPAHDGEAAEAAFGDTAQFPMRSGCPSSCWRISAASADPVTVRARSRARSTPPSARASPASFLSPVRATTATATSTITPAALSLPRKPRPSKSRRSRTEPWTLIYGTRRPIGSPSASSLRRRRLVPIPRPLDRP
jgi:subtilisin family serine protease